ncbi:MAG: FHA domain-containing protein [Myxococcota bacterium]
MGVLEGPDGQQVALLPRMLVGRSPSCDLVLDDPSVSAEHAVIAWLDGRWRVRDLGSRNGTAIAERPATSEPQPLEVGDRVAFGRAPSWTLVDADPPTRDGVLAATEQAAGLDDVAFAFTVSADEEHAAWAITAPVPRPLGDRVHAYLLLTLARARLEDAQAGVAPADRGWRYADPLARGLGITPEVLKVYVYRARNHLGPGRDRRPPLDQRGGRRATRSASAPTASRSCGRPERRGLSLGVRRATSPPMPRLAATHPTHAHHHGPGRAGVR